MPLHETTIEELIDEQLIEETKQFIRDQSEKIFYLEKETVSKKIDKLEERIKVLENE